MIVDVFRPDPIIIAMTPPLTRPFPFLFWAIALWGVTVIIALPFAKDDGLAGWICSTAIVITSILFFGAAAVGFVRANFLVSSDDNDKK